MQIAVAGRVFDFQVSSVDGFQGREKEGGRAERDPEML